VIEVHTLYRAVLARPGLDAEIGETMMQQRRRFVEADQCLGAKAARLAWRTLIASDHVTAPESGGCPSSNMSSVERNGGIQGL